MNLLGRKLQNNDFFRSNSLDYDSILREKLQNVINITLSDLISFLLHMYLRDIHDTEYLIRRDVSLRLSEINRFSQ